MRKKRTLFFDHKTSGLAQTVSWPFAIWRKKIPFKFAWVHQFHEFFEGVLPFTHVLLSVPFYEKKDHSFSAIRQVDWPRQLADLLQFDEKNPAKIRMHATSANRNILNHASISRVLWVSFTFTHEGRISGCHVVLCSLYEKRTLFFHSKTSRLAGLHFYGILVVGI